MAHISKLDEIINEIVSDSSGDDMGTDWEGIAADGKRQIKRLMLEIIDDLDGYDDLVLQDIQDELRQKVEEQ